MREIFHLVLEHETDVILKAITLQFYRAVVVEIQTDTTEELTMSGTLAFFFPTAPNVAKDIPIWNWDLLFLTANLVYQFLKHTTVFHLLTNEDSKLISTVETYCNTITWTLNSLVPHYNLIEIWEEGYKIM